MLGIFGQRGLLFAGVLLRSLSAQAGELTTLKSFDEKNGAFPSGSLIADAEGNLYGTTAEGGGSKACDGNGFIGCGTVFKLTSPAAGQVNWTETVLVSFTGANGALPLGGLIADAAGNLYGTTSLGGASTNCGSEGCGTVFEVSPPQDGKSRWVEHVIASFDKVNGADPHCNLIRDAAGNLYGTTEYGGSSGYGTVFKLSWRGGGRTKWDESVLTSFNYTNGSNPLAGLVADAAGNLYGTTYGGASGFGTVFMLSPPAAGQTSWTETVLVAFDDTNGSGPVAGLVADAAGNLYGTTFEGGNSYLGTAYKLSPPAGGNGVWTETVLVSFNGNNGAYPQAGLTVGPSGILFGATTDGGGSAACNYNNVVGCGTVFELAPPGAGQALWTETVLAALAYSNGAQPVASVIADAAGDLYGTTQVGVPKAGCKDTAGCGAVFKLAP
jgi:uncharacterized repeat protein (TIGR03803 family)